MSTTSPWILQEQLLAKLCAFGKLVPVPEMQFRYRVPETDLLIDVMSPDGINVGGGTSWMRQAAEAAADRTLPDGRVVRVLTPPYFVVLKLTAFLDRGEDLISAKDMEDIVCIAIEVDDLVDQVDAARLTSAIESLWRDVFKKHSADVTYIPDVVDAHLHREDRDRRERAIEILRSLADEHGGGT
jgi:hypothetical protein